MIHARSITSVAFNQIIKSAITVFNLNYFVNISNAKRLEYITCARPSISSQRETWSTRARERPRCVGAYLRAASAVCAAFIYILKIKQDQVFQLISKYWDREYLYILLAE